jgi:hypothetical protein
VVEFDINLAGDRRLDFFLPAVRFDWVNVTVLHHFGRFGRTWAMESTWSKLVNSTAIGPSC